MDFEVTSGSPDENRPTTESGASTNGAPLQQNAAGGYEGAERNSRELASWRPDRRPSDMQINVLKPIMDARGRDMTRNSGLVSGAVSVHRDSIVGSQFRLNAKPDWRVLGQTPEWAEAFQIEVESKFGLYAESNDCWIDASRMNTLTGLIRLAIAGFIFTGEVVGTAEWLKDRSRPFRSALQLINPDRLSNPGDTADTKFMRRGVEKNVFGAPVAYHIRVAHELDNTAFTDNYKWKRVPARTPWGRMQVLHIIEQMNPDQTRGVSEMVAVLKEMRMTKNFHEITLQKAVLQASFAASIESELPPAEAFASLGMGEGANVRTDYATSFLEAISEYTANSRNMQLDGVKIPHLFPGTKLNLMQVGQPGGIGTTFEESLLRHTAAGLGLSYEEFSRDYTKTNYSSARASGNNTWRYMQSRKKSVADRTATAVFALWLEEAINNDALDCMRNSNIDFYAGQNKDALIKCTWIGASRGQVDELKETQAAVMRVRGGFSTYEAECARLGTDYREVFEQRAREEKLATTLGIDLNPVPVKEGTLSGDRGSKKPKKDTEEA